METINSSEKQMNSVPKTIINPWKEYWLIQESTHPLFSSPVRYPLSNMGSEDFDKERNQTYTPVQCETRAVTECDLIPSQHFDRKRQFQKKKSTFKER